MKPAIIYRDSRRTSHIQLDTRKCTACWKCQEICSFNVLGKVNIPWHRHAVIRHGHDCTGCLRCVKICESNALSEVSDK